MSISTILESIKTKVKSLPTLVATIGQSPDFGYFFAHSQTAAVVVSRVPKGIPRFIFGGVLVLVALYKEFVFDLRKEKNPPQTVLDSTKDFVGYIVGLVEGQIL